MKINNLSETAVTLTFGGKISISTHHEVMSFHDYLKSQKLLWLKELVPAYTSLSAFVDFSFYINNSSLKLVFSELYEEFKKHELPKRSRLQKTVVLEVDYNGEDIQEVASYCKISVDELIKIHTEPEYLVAMIGFTPGFPYLLGLDSRLVIPRKETPRTRVPKGSVAIGGEQTGIYPQESPGGWHILGYIKESLFDVHKNPPNLLNAGDKVRFVAK